jgi:hypothetical protein
MSIVVVEERRKVLDKKRFKKESNIYNGYQLLYLRQCDSWLTLKEVS